MQTIEQRIAKLELQVFSMSRILTEALKLIESRLQVLEGTESDEAEETPTIEVAH